MDDETLIHSIADNLSRAVRTARDDSYAPWQGNARHAPMFVLRCSTMAAWLQNANRYAWDLRDEEARARAEQLVEFVERWCRDHAADELDRLYTRRRPRAKRAKVAHV